MRTSNYNCDECGKRTYVRPSHFKKHKHHFCSRICHDQFRSIPIKQCGHCLKEFKPTHRKIQFCSQVCANIARTRARGKYKYRGRNAVERRLNELKDHFNFDYCMVEGCKYNRLYEIHRLVEGKDGGEYVVGNMFAVCPNHHAEIHRKLCTVIKVSDQLLRIQYKTGE